MLKQWEKTERPSDANLEERLQEARRKLQEQQLKGRARTAGACACGRMGNRR